MDSGLRPPLQSSKHPRDKEPDDLEKLRQWQEERLQRKLRGEYESALLHLNEIVYDNLSTQLRIADVRVEGADKTRPSFLGSLIRPILAPKEGEEPNLATVLQKAQEIGDVLQRTDIFKSVEARIERSRNDLADPSDVDLVFKTREKGKYFLNTSTELGNNEGSASATGRARNVFGGGETFEANISSGTKTKRSFRATLTAPLTHTLGTHGELSAFGLSRDNTSFASCSEEIRGAKALVRHGSLALPAGLHEFTYEAALRRIGNLTPTASMCIRKEAGESIKSSIAHTWTRDTRDNKLTSTQGYYLKTHNEYAGLGGQAAFYKSEVEGQISRPLIPGTAISFAARSGLLWNLSHRSYLPDRFQLGGPTSVRAFKNNTLGPRDGGDSLGGDIYYSLGVSLISDIPTKPHWPIKSHLWANAGRLDTIDKSKPLLESIKRPSISAGLGIIYNFEPVRIEVNFGLPLVASKSDGSRRGLQVGVGLEFL